MKKVLCLIVATLILLCGCSPVSQSGQSHTDTSSKEDAFTKNENGNIVGNSGVEYTLLANEGLLYYLGDLDFIGSIQGEEKSSQHLGLSIKCQMKTIKK